MRLRSRGGCMTCKTRRVKCDEEKPVCHRCRSTGRRCDGYQPGPTLNYNSRDVKIIQYTPSISRQAQGWLPHLAFSDLTTEQNWRSWEFFHLQTASCFGHKAGDFLLSAANLDPLIRAAALALGSLHRMFLYEGGDNGRDTVGRQTALRQYNIAVRRALNQLSQSPTDSIDTILTMCALFYCAECLQGHYQAALRHVASGVRILRHQEQLRLGGRSHSGRPHQSIRSILAIMENQLLEVGGELSIPDNIKPYTSADLHVPFEDLPGTMSTLEELGDGFRVVYNNFLHVFSLEEYYAKDTLEEERVLLKAQYMDAVESAHRFSTAFDRFLATNPQHTEDENARIHIKTLQMWRLTVGVILQAGLPPSDSAWDKHTNDYTEILSLAEAIISNTGLAPSGPVHPPKPTGKTEKMQPLAGHGGHNTTRGRVYTSILPKPQSSRSPSLFSLSLGVLPVLWIVAVSCRDSKTRYRAIHLMARSNRQEGIWNSRLYARVATRVARLEEQSAGILEGADYEPCDIPMSARVSAVMGRFDEGREGNVRFLWGKHEALEESIVW